jgi:catechol 2,3-dioxygenase-like lactoylglutathione lyase family enzyme
LSSVEFSGGCNIALKVPPHQFEDAVRLYRDILGLEALTRHLPDIVFRFGHNQLWIDCVPGMSQADIWLELTTPDLDTAKAHLSKCGVTRRDDIEALPEKALGGSGLPSLLRLFT